MSKRILLLTTIYPSPDLNLMNGTNVCHYFAKEWVELGYEVQVIFNYPVYSTIVHGIADLLGKKVASIGQSYFITKKLNSLDEYSIDNVKVLRAPLYKVLPKVAISKKAMDAQVKLISAFLEKKQFYPDVVVAHFCYPHLEMVAKLKEQYQCKTAVVNHIQSLPLKRYIGDKYLKYMDDIDVWGYRSASIKRNFENQFGQQKGSFFCPSGVPEDYILDKPKSFVTKLGNYVYVGSLIKRKYPLVVLKSLATLSLGSCVKLTYVGEGIERASIEQYASRVEDRVNVRLVGNLSRQSVFKELDDAECFIMISKGETFGLVYLEAMARGLITVASRGEGMEGIIEDGINGFLCEAGNEYELTTVLNRISKLSVEDKERISNNAIHTAFRFSDKSVAKSYLNAII